MSRSSLIVRCDIAELLPSVTMLSLRLLVSQDCDGDNVQCLVVRCDIAELSPADSAVITFHARLWNRTISRVSCANYF